MITQIPLSIDPNQTFSTIIYGDTKNLALTFTMSWNAVAQYWGMGISSTSTGDSIVQNIPLLPGINLIEQYQHLGIGSAAAIINIGDPTILVPNSTTLASNFALYWLYTA